MTTRALPSFSPVHDGPSAGAGAAYAARAASGAGNGIRFIFGLCQEPLLIRQKKKNDAGYIKDFKKSDSLYDSGAE
jgi:hypothetical protein